VQPAVPLGLGDPQERLWCGAPQDPLVSTSRNPYPSILVRDRWTKTSSLQLDELGPFPDVWTELSPRSFVSFVASSSVSALEEDAVTGEELVRGWRFSTNEKESQKHKMKKRKKVSL
jgi:hypothetical protein